MSDTTIREAVDGDIPAILAIDSGDEFDYLHDYLPYYMKQADQTCFVVEIEQEIVGFMVMRIVDAGQTVTFKAIRISEAFRGRGIITALKPRVLPLAIAKGCTRIVIPMYATTPALTSGRLEQSHKEIYRKAYQMTEVHAGIILPAPGDDKTLGQVYDQTLEAYISNPHIRRYMFPRDIIYADHVPFRSLTANIPLLRGKQTTFYSDVSFETEREEITGLMSAGTPWRYRTGAPAYIIDLFGADVSSVERHILMHVKLCLTFLANNNVTLRIYYENDHRIEKEVQTVFTGLKLSVNEAKRGCAVILERNLVT